MLFSFNSELTWQENSPIISDFISLHGDGPPYRSVTIVPLLSREGESIGVLTVDRRERNYFSSDSIVSALQVMAGRIASVATLWKVEHRAPRLHLKAKTWDHPIITNAS